MEDQSLTRHLRPRTGLNFGSLSPEQMLPKILDCAFEIFWQADRGFVVLRGPEPGVLVPKAMKLRRGDSEDTIGVNRSAVRKAMDCKEALLLAEAADREWDGSQSTAHLRISTMCAPLLSSDGAAFGAILIDTFNSSTPFLRGDLDLFAALAGQAALALERARLRGASDRAG